MQSQPSLISRHDTFFGVCEAIGQDFGFNANLLRVALGLGVIFAPLAVFGVYAGLGVVVLVSRKLFPVGGCKAAKVAVPAEAHPAARNDDQILETALAA
jgi:phage shock protein PspC (stress-responsive transcriptional regulator)